MIDKYLFTYWHANNMPLFTQRCIARMKVIMPDWKVVVFHRESAIREFGVPTELSTRLEKDYLKKFCNSNGINFYETEGFEIFNIPRTSEDLL